MIDDKSIISNGLASQNSHDFVGIDKHILDIDSSCLQIQYGYFNQNIDTELAMET